MTDTTNQTNDTNASNGAADNDVDLPKVDELTSLKQRADQMGIQYHPSIGLEKLREKVNAHVNGTAVAQDQVADVNAAQNGAVTTQAADEPVAPAEETANERRARKKREANELVRVRVTCMNPGKKEWEGEIFTAGNSLVGSFTKFIPFNADEGWHVPRIILNQIQQRQCQIFTTVRDARGNATRQSKLIKEFAIEILPNLTPEELQDLAQRQAMSKSIG